jgi:hypothetical protein
MYEIPNEVTQRLQESVEVVCVTGAFTPCSAAQLLSPASPSSYAATVSMTCLSNPSV